MGKGLEQDAWACAQAQEVARSAVDGWERRMLNSETRLSSFAAALPHVPSFNASIQLQVVRVSIERRTRAASQPLTAHIHTTHHPAQPPTGASFLPISCFIRTSGRPPGPSATPERRPQTGEKSIKKSWRCRQTPCRPCARQFPTRGWIDGSRSGVSAATRALRTPAGPVVWI